jgi:hypothetical protein
MVFAPVLSAAAVGVAWFGLETPEIQDDRRGD